MKITDCIKNVVQPILEDQLDPSKFKNIPVPALIGPPGIGKSQILSEELAKNDWVVLNVCFPTIAFEELTGVPRGVDLELGGKKVFSTEWSVPEIIFILNALAEKYEKVVLFLDDIHLCDQHYQRYLFSLLDVRKLKQYKLPDNCAIVAAGNQTTLAGAQKILSPIISRLAYLKVEPDIESWFKYISDKENYYLPIISFLKIRPDLFNTEERSEPFANPRTWEYLNYVLTKLQVDISDINKYSAVVEGIIGKDAGSEFVTHVYALSKVDVDQYLDGMKKIPGDDIATVWLIATASTHKIFGPGKRINTNLVDRWIDNILLPVVNIFADIGILCLKLIFFHRPNYKSRIIDRIKNSHPDIIDKLLDLF